MLIHLKHWLSSEAGAVLAASDDDELSVFSEAKITCLPSLRWQVPHDGMESKSMDMEL